MIVTTRTIPAADALTLASLPLLPPPIPVAVPLDREVAQRFVGASIPPRTRTTYSRTVPIMTAPAPRAARSHIALEGAAS